MIEFLQLVREFLRPQTEQDKLKDQLEGMIQKRRELQQILGRLGPELRELGKKKGEEEHL